MQPPLIRLAFTSFLAVTSALAFLACCPFTQAASNSTANDKIQFQKSIEPLLVKRCSECHGPDKEKAKFRIDSAARALKGGESGKPGIVPGHSDQSEVVKRLLTQDPDEVMPPKGERLTPAEVQLIRDWIDQGADWSVWKPSDHWAFKTLTQPSIPTDSDPAWSRNAVDAFILHGLNKAGLKSAPEADKATLLRRLSLDIIGLPPTPAELDAFLQDTSANAYEKQIDRLLASPHYGEHMARWWLDLARYADSNGYQVDLTRSIWPYRDWVIRAFNSNMPFDQFTIEQLAGDLLPNATMDQKIATGFNRNTKINDEGGGDAEEYRTKAVKDRVATTATTWLGLTMMCAECHTHKYDPISQEEYYKFYAFFNSSTDSGNHTVEPAINVPPPNTESKVSFLRSQQQSVRAQLAQAEQSAAQDQAQWESQLIKAGNVWTTLALTNAISTGGSTFTNLPDQSALATGVNPIYDTITIEAAPGSTTIRAILLETLADPSLPKNGPGRWGQSGNFILDEITAGILNTEEGKVSRPIEFQRATADWEQLYYRAEHTIDANPKTGWAIGPKFGQNHFLILELKQPITLAEGERIQFKFEHYHGSSHTIGRFRISTTSESNPSLLWPANQGIRDIVAKSPAQRSAPESAQLAAHFRQVSPTLRNLQRALYDLNQRESELANTRFSTLIMQERPEPRPTHIHIRGNFLEKGQQVSPGFLAFIPPPPATEATNRLTLARWLVQSDNPLTARVTVNRFWERFFGTAIAKTSEDVGRQGEPPSHPELLDWLATSFIQSGWDMKAIQKTLLMSATYRQSSVTDSPKLEKDFYNRLLSRGPRFRLDGEVIRDIALSVSGLLNTEIGGPSVYPVQIPNLWKEIGFLRPEIGMDEWPLSTGPDLHRRGVYTFWRRVCTYPTFATFDAPSRDTCTSRRPRTNTPLQALAALNDPALLEAAGALAQRILHQGGSTVQTKLEFAFRLCLSRPPTQEELRRLTDYLAQQEVGFRQSPTEAAELLKSSQIQSLYGQARETLAAWTMVANVLLNLDEWITKG